MGMDVACVASVSVRFRNQERGTRAKNRAKNGSLIRHQMEELATQARMDGAYHILKESEEQRCH